MKKSTSITRINEERLFVGVISTILFFNGIQRGGAQLVIADICSLFGSGSEGIGILAAIEHITPLFMPFLMGLLADKIGKKPITVVFTALFAVGCLICGFSQGMFLYIVGLIIYSTGSAVCENVSTAALADTNESKSMQYINISQFMFSLGAVVGPLLVELFQRNGIAGWQSPFFIGSGAFVLMTIVLIVIKFPPMPEKTKVLIQESESDEKTSFLSPLLLCLAIGMIIYIGYETGFANYCDSLMNSKHVSSNTNALTLSAFWAGMSISRLIFGFISYKPGKCLRICFIAMAICTAALVFINIPILCVLFSFAAGFAGGPIWTTINATAAAQSGGNTGAAVGLMCVANGIGGIIIPALMAWISGSMSVPSAIMALAIACILGFIVNFAIKDH